MAEVDVSILSDRWRRCGGVSAKQHCIDAPTSRAVEKHKEKYPVQNHGQLYFVKNGEKLVDRAPRMGVRLCRGVYHKIGNIHFTNRNNLNKYLDKMIS